MTRLMAHDPRFRVERVVTLALVAAACAFALYHDRALPAPLGLDAPASVFSEARAAAFASSLDAPRLAGSDAEHAALEKLERALRGVAAETRAASSGRVVVDVLRTRHSGTFPLRGPGVRETREQTMAYDRLDALAARVRVWVPPHHRDDDSNESRHALLFAAHIDTVHVSPGGCDNAANVAVVLETVRAFAAGLCGSDSAAHREHREHTPPVSRVSFTNDSSSSSSHDGYYVTPLIAMFVSAEEDGFMGARGVVRDHPWFEAHVAAFANFEAMGVGGPHRAFRATVGGSSSALLRLYAQGAPRPSGTVVASDVFSSGFIKSDTDFRVFRDDGDVPGIDLAFVERTYLYHTPRDTVRALVNGRPGSMQGSGENALGFARAFMDTSVMRRSHVSLKNKKKGARFQGVVTKGGVSTTSRRVGVRLGAKATSSETSSETSFKNSLTVWFAFPAFQNAFVVLDVDGAQVATAVALAAVTSTALATNFLGFGFGGFSTPRIERHSESEDTATLLLAIVVGVAGAAVAFVAAPVAGGLAALVTASVTGTPTLWAKSLGAFVLCVVPSSVAAALGTLDATRRLTRVLFESAANDSRRFRSRRDSFAATAKETCGEKKTPTEKNADETSQDAAQRTASDVTRTRLHARADRVALVGAALFLALLASYAFFRNVAGAYLFAVPAFGIFLGASFAGTEDDHSMALDARASKSIGSCVFGAFARAAPLAFAASLAFPTCFALVDLAHGMAPRSRPPPGTSEYLYDIVCGVVAGGAVAASAFPSLAFLVSTRDPRESSSRTSAERRFVFAKAFAVTIAAIAASRVAYLYAAIDAPHFTEDFPQQLSAFAAVTSGNVSDAALVFLPAGPGSVERAFKQTLESLESFGSFGSFTSPAEKTRNTTTESSTKYACDGSADYGVLRRWDLASYSLSGSGACAALSASLSRELAEAAASGKEIVTEIRVRAGAPRAAAGNASVVPITVDTRGATRWVIAVDARCAKRVAFAQGQDAEREDAEAEAGEFNRASLRAGKSNQGERTKRGDGDGDGDGESSPSEKKKPTRASPPVGPWRLASNGRAGSGTGTRRYAAFGVGGREARERPEPITVWIETHAVTERFFFETDGAVSKKCARDAVRVRADFDFETATAAAARAATPAWVVPFAKHHTPLKLAVLAVAGLDMNMTDGHVAT